MLHPCHYCIRLPHHFHSRLCPTYAGVPVAASAASSSSTAPPPLELTSDVPTGHSRAPTKKRKHAAIGEFANACRKYRTYVPQIEKAEISLSAVTTKDIVQVNRDAADKGLVDFLVLPDKYVTTRLPEGIVTMCNVRVIISYVRFSMSQIHARVSFSTVISSMHANVVVVSVALRVGLTLYFDTTKLWLGRFLCLW